MRNISLTLESPQIGVRPSRLQHSLVHNVVHTKAEVLHVTPGLHGLGVLFNCHALEMYWKHLIK